VARSFSNVWRDPDAGDEAGVIGEDGAPPRRPRPGREPDVALHAGADHAQGQPELDGQVEVDVEELGPELQRAHVGVEVADVEAPQDGPLDLGPALPPHLVEVGVVPHVLHRPREPAVAAEQRRGVGDRAPAVELVLGVEGQVDPDVLAPVAARRLAGPRARHHQGGAGDDPVARHSKTPTLAEWHEPRSSALMMRSLASAA
jgi:hypothetical protein